MAQVNRLNVLINNSGVAWGQSIDDFPESGWDKVKPLDSIFVMMNISYLLLHSPLVLLYSRRISLFPTSLLLLLLPVHL